MFETGRVLVCFHFVLMNKKGTRISVGENYQAQQPLIQDLPQHVALNQTNMARHTENRIDEIQGGNS